MSFSKTVVINCAGVGSRLGMGTTKALVNLAGRPLIAWQLDMLKEVEDVRVVVGFQAEQVIETVLSLRRNITFVFNHQYLATGTAASLSLGARHASGMVVSLDGDLLVHPDDFDRFLKLEYECLGYVTPSSEVPVYVTTRRDSSDTTWVTGFSWDSGDFEWSGLVQVHAEKLTMTSGHVFQLLEHSLPLRGVPIRCREVDTPADYDAAVAWVRMHLM